MVKGARGTFTGASNWPTPAWAGRIPWREASPRPLLRRVRRRPLNPSRHMGPKLEPAAPDCVSARRYRYAEGRPYGWGGLLSMRGQSWACGG